MANDLSINRAAPPKAHSSNMVRAWEVRNNVWNAAQTKGLTQDEVKDVLNGLAPPSGEPGPQHMAELSKVGRGNEVQYLISKLHTPPSFGSPTASGQNGHLVVNSSGMRDVETVSVKVRYPTYVRDFTPPKFPVKPDGSVSIVRTDLLEGTKGDKVQVAITCVPKPTSAIALKLGVPKAEPQTVTRDFYT